jgi:hypothetical protein
MDTNALGLPARTRLRLSSLLELLFDIISPFDRHAPDGRAKRVAFRESQKNHDTPLARL